MNEIDELLYPAYEQSKAIDFDTHQMIMGLRLWLRLTDSPLKKAANTPIFT